MEDNIILQIRKELQSKGDPNIKQGAKRYFKEKIELYGLKNPEINAMANSYFKKVKDLPKPEIYKLVETLFSSGMYEEVIIGIDWVYRYKNFQEEDFQIYERWIDKYIDNWAECDTFCNHTMGSFLEKYPRYLENLLTWAKSKNRWMKRASAVSLIVPGKNGRFLPEIFKLADVLLLDKDDMVQKGYGWMLKVASQRHLKEVFDYVNKNKDVMPRTALRYAIEKMPVEMKKEAMAKIK